MKNAPNLKHQPKDAFAEAIIFAGADAWIHAKDWQDNNKVGDTVPPIKLGPTQLKDLASLRIVDDGRRYVRVYRAGALDGMQITAIATRLALADVQEARFYSESLELVEDWTPRLSGLKAEAERGDSVVVSLPVVKKANGVTPALNQMGPSQRGDVLAAHYDNDLAIDVDSDTVHHYNGVVWSPVQDMTGNYS